MKAQLSKALLGFLIVLIIVSGAVGYLAGSQPAVTVTSTIITTATKTVTSLVTYKETLTSTETIATPVTNRETMTLTTTVTTPITYTETKASVTTKTITTSLTYTTTVTETVSPTPPKDTFILTSWNTTVFHDISCLYITFKTKATVTLKIIGPDGARKDTKVVSPDEGGAYLYMAGFGETPSAGTYKLVVSTLFGTVFEKNITLNGYSLEVKSSRVGKSWSDILQGTIKSVELGVLNSGDMPTYLKEIRISIAGKEETAYAADWLVVGEVDITTPLYITGIPPGKHEMKIVLVNDKGNVLDIATVEVTFP